MLLCLVLQEGNGELKFSYLLFKPSQSESSFYHTETFSL